MTAYYNEIDPYAAQWIRNLIAAGHIAAGDVDERSIEDVKPGQGLLVGSSCGQGGDGTSGTEPKPLKATYSLRDFAPAHYVRGRACALFPAHGLLRRIHSVLERFRLLGKTEYGSSQVAVFLLSSTGTNFLCRGWQRETLGLFCCCAPFDILLNIFVFDSRQGWQKTSSHTPYNFEGLRYLFRSSSSGTLLRISESKTRLSGEELSMPPHNSYKKYFSYTQPHILADIL